MLLNWLRKSTNAVAHWLRDCGRKKPTRRRTITRPTLDILEDRLVPANIVWANQGNDGFDAAYGAIAQAARAIVNQAISDWERVITDFGDRAIKIQVAKSYKIVYSHIDTFNVYIYAGNTVSQEGNPTLGNGMPYRDALGKPYGAILNLDDDAAGGGWFFDTTPWEHSEFTAIDIFSGNNGPSGSDLYTAVLHELGHGVGFDGHVNGSSYPNDLMYAELPQGTRRLISNHDANALNDAWDAGFHVVLPSTIVGGSFLSELNPNTGVVTLHGDVVQLFPSTADDIFSIHRVGDTLHLGVGGYAMSIPLANVTAINVLGGEGAELLLVNFEQGNPIPVGGITFDGGNGLDLFHAVGSANTDIFTLNSASLQFGDRTVNFNSVDNLLLEGRGGTDTFYVKGVQLGVNVEIQGGTANDYVYLGNNANRLDNILGPVQFDGGAGTDYLYLYDQGAAVQMYELDGDTIDRGGIEAISFADISYLNLYAGSASDQFQVLAPPPSTEVRFHGGGGSDTVAGPYAANVWDITGANQGTLNSTIRFYQTENLQGHDGSDFFHFHDLASLSGEIDGGHDAQDFLHYSNYDSAVSINLLTNAATGIAGGAFNIERFVGSAFADTFIGHGAAGAWTLDAGHTNRGSAAYLPQSGGYAFTYHFTGFENLTGGNQNDTFVFGQGAQVTGTINGGGGLHDALDYSQWNTGVTVNLNTVAGIEVVIGGDGSDTLIGKGNSGQNHHWHITGPNQGIFDGWGLLVEFTDIENLTGSVADDTFHFGEGAALAGMVNGGNFGYDVIDYSACTSAVTVNLHNHTATGLTTFHNIDVIRGSQGADTLMGPGAPAGITQWNLLGLNLGNINGNAFGFSSFEKLTGGAGFDTFVFHPGAGVSGDLQGGGNLDSLDYQSWQSGVEVYLNGQKAAGVAGAVWGIENVTGSQFDDILGGNGADNVLAGLGGNDLILGHGGNDNLSGGSGFDLLIGGEGADKITGGTGDDVIIGGTTAYDSHAAALAALLADWARPQMTYAERVALLSTPKGDGSAYLDISTVHADEAVDLLFGQGDNDWFWGVTGGQFADLLDAAVGEEIRESAAVGTA